MNASQMKLRVLLWLPLLVLAAMPARSSGHWRRACDPCRCCCWCWCCEPAPCCIITPRLFTECRTQLVTRYRPEVRERLVTVTRDVPTIGTIEEKYTVLTPKTRMRTVVDTLNHPVYGDIQLRATTMKSRIEARQASYTVTQMIPQQEQRCENPDCCPTCASVAPTAATTTNQWEFRAPPPAPREATAASGKSTTSSTSTTPSAPSAPSVSTPAVGEPCNTCNTCNISCTPRKVCVTTWKPVYREEKVQYPVTHFEPNSRLEQVAFYEFQPEEKSREEPYVVMEPETRTRTREITVMKTVSEQQRERYTVMVPYQERIQVPVSVCR